MNQRFIWNFEINTNKPLDLTNLADERDELKWEARYFFSPEEQILLGGLDEQFLLISNHEVKQREDRYVLLTDHPFNIKHRRQELLYKPLIEQNDLLSGYSKKINLEEYPSNRLLPGSENLTANALLNHIKHSGEEIAVSKEALIYKFPTTPKIKLELARLVINSRIYYSVCIEGRSKTLVTRLAEQLLGNRSSCDYVSFLKQTLRR